MKKTIAMFALGISVAYGQHFCQGIDPASCTRPYVSPTPFDPQLEPLKGEAVSVDSCTWCGKVPQ